MSEVKKYTDSDIDHAMFCFLYDGKMLEQLSAQIALSGEMVDTINQHTRILDDNDSKDSKDKNSLKDKLSKDDVDASVQVLVKMIPKGREISESLQNIVDSIEYRESGSVKSMYNRLCVNADIIKQNSAYCELGDAELKAIGAQVESFKYLTNVIECTIISLRGALAKACYIIYTSNQKSKKK